MSYSVILTPKVLKSAKLLSKKHHSFKDDLGRLISELTLNPRIGTPLGKNLYKLRLAIKSKNKGKSGGARAITYVDTITLQPTESGEVVLLALYDKTDVEAISTKEIYALLSKYLEE